MKYNNNYTASWNYEFIMKKGNMPKAISNQTIFQNLMEAEVGNVGYKLGSRLIQLKKIKTYLIRAIDRMATISNRTKYKGAINLATNSIELLKIMEIILSETR
jgi:hypothetical protein